MKKFVAACVISAAFLAAPAGDAHAACRVALVPFKGPGAGELQDIVVTSLPGECLSVPGRVANGPGASAALARQLGAGAFIEGKVIKLRRWYLRLWVRRVGAFARKAAWTGRRRRELLATVQRGAPAALRAMLKDRRGLLPSVPPPGGEPSAAPEPAAPPPAAAPAPAPVAEESAPAAEEKPAADIPAPAEEAPPPRRALAERTPSPGLNDEPPGLAALAPAAPLVRHPMLEMSVGPRVISRAFSYTDNLSGLPGYTLGGALAVAAEGEFFPTANSKRGVDIGIGGEFESSVGAKTTGPGGAPADTRVRHYRVGGRLRIPAHSFLFTLGGDYGEHQFEVDVNAMVPNVRYAFLRPSLGMRIDTGGKLSLGLTAAYLHILSVGGLNDQSRFPRITAVGAEVDASLGYAIDESLEVRLVADLRHYAQSMHVNPGDPYIAGGALDEHFGGSFLLTYRLR
jgi:hypothetical protein